MEPKVRLDGVLGGGRDECLERGSDGVGARLVDAGGGQRCGLGLDPDPEVHHVEHVVMGADRRGFHRERRGLGHREHERAAALEGFDEALRPKPGDRLPDHRAGDAVLVDELGFRGQLVPGGQFAGKDLVLQAHDHPLRQCGRHPNSALSFVKLRIWSLSVKPSPGRSGTQMRPSRISMRSLNNGFSHSKCSTHGSVG